MANNVQTKDVPCLEFRTRGIRDELCLSSPFALLSMIPAHTTRSDKEREPDREGTTEAQKIGDPVIPLLNEFQQPESSAICEPSTSSRNPKDESIQLCIRDGVLCGTIFVLSCL